MATLKKLFKKKKTKIIKLLRMKKKRPHYINIFKKLTRSTQPIRKR